MTQVVEILSVKEVANILQFHPATVREYLREGKIKGIKLKKEWRVLREDLTDWLEKQRI